MEAREFKIDINQQDPLKVSQEEQRLKAIKKILVGNQIERLENRFRGLSRRVESTNGHLVSTVEDLSNEFTRLKAEMKLGGSLGAVDGQELQKNIQTLLKEHKGLNLEDSSICQKLEERINTIENSINASQTLGTESNEQINAMTEDIQQFKLKLKSTQERLSKLDQVARPEDKAKVDQRLSSLEAKISTLNPKKLEARLGNRQDEFEDGVQDLVERLAGRVNERFDFASKGRKKLANGQDKLTQRQNDLAASQKHLIQGQEELINGQLGLADKISSLNEGQEIIENRQLNISEQHKALVDQTLEVINKQGALTNRVDGIQEVLENDIMNFLKNVQVDKGAIEEHVKSFAGDLERKIYENNVRMEAKIDAFIDMSSRQARPAAPVQEDPKLKAIKDALKNLSSLLDE